VDLVLHAGDLTTAGVLRELERVAPVVAVQGNHDRRAGLDLPRRAVVRVGGVRVGLVHGDLPRPLETCWAVAGVAAGRPVTPGLVRAVARRAGPVDCAVFGHHHLPVLARAGRTLVFSPGAAYTVEADPGYVPAGLRGRLYARYRARIPEGAARPAVGILEIRDGVVRPRIVPVEGPLRPGGGR
jgi:putative phosphoesterase